MLITPKALASIVLLALLFTGACAATPDPKPQALPEGHPPVKNQSAIIYRDTQADAYAAYMYSLMLAEEGRNREAIGFLQMASQLDSRSPQILDQLMRIYMSEHRYAEAAETAEKILLIDQQWTNAHVMLGQIYLNTDRPFEAVNHLEIALELDPGQTNVIFLLADGLERTGDIERAIKSLEELTDSSGHQAIAHYYIAPPLSALRGHPIFSRLPV